MLKKADLPAPPQLKSQVVPVPELGGDVMVRGIMLKDRLKLSITDGYGRVAGLLAVCVLVQDDKGEYVPLYDIDEWERWGNKHFDASITLWDVARKLSGLDAADTEKNSPARTPE